MTMIDRSREVRSYPSGDVVSFGHIKPDDLFYFADVEGVVWLALSHPYPGEGGLLVIDAEQVNYY